MLEGKTDLSPPLGLERTLTLISSHDCQWETKLGQPRPDATGGSSWVLGFVLLGSLSLVSQVLA